MKNGTKLKLKFNGKMYKNLIYCMFSIGSNTSSQSQSHLIAQFVQFILVDKIPLDDETSLCVRSARDAGGRDRRIARIDQENPGHVRWEKGRVIVMATEELKSDSEPDSSWQWLPDVKVRCRVGTRSSGLVQQE